MRKVAIRPVSLEVAQKRDDKSRIEEIYSLHKEIVGNLKSALENAVRIGELLTEQKKILAHGKFMEWVKANLPFNHRTADRYMSVYRHRDELKMDNVTNLSNAYGFLKQLTRPGLIEKGGEAEKKFIFKVFLDDTGYEVLMEALNTAKNLLGNPSNGRALQHVCHEWLSFY